MIPRDKLLQKRRMLAVWGHAMAVDFRGHPMFQRAGFNAPTR
jgi:hypothetical protein